MPISPQQSVMLLLHSLGPRVCTCGWVVTTVVVLYWEKREKHTTIKERSKRCTIYISFKFRVFKFLFRSISPSCPTASARFAHSTHPVGMSTVHSGAVTSKDQWMVYTRSRESEAPASCHYHSSLAPAASSVQYGTDPPGIAV